MKNRTDLILGEAFCIFIFFYFLDSGLSVLNGLQFYFRLRDSENRELLKFILNLALFSFKNVFFMLLSLFSYLFHENETFETLRSVDFQLFRDLVWFVALCR